MPHWGKAFFRKEIFDPGEPEAMAQAAAEAAFVFRALGVKKGARVLDLCCGVGRHSFELARRGAVVTGLDATSAYLAEARARLRGRVNPVFVRGDMRRLSFREEFDAAVCLWTSFGYFDDPREDLRVLEGVRRALKPGGYFLLDMIDGAWVAAHAPPKNWTRRADGAVVLEEVRLRGGADPAHANTWTVLRPGRKPERARFFVRNYDFVRLSRALARAGLSVVRRFKSLGPSGRGGSTRLVVLARKPA